MLGPDELAFTPVVPDEPTVKELFPKEETPAGESTVAGKRVNKWKGQSMYPVLLEELINTVLEREHFLFSETERIRLEHLRLLSYSSRYLFIRLALRRRSKLHRLSDLEAKYADELYDDTLTCIKSLCTPLSSSFGAGITDPIDVDATNEAGPCPPQDKHPELYAHDETNLTTEELLVALKGDELKEIATKLKVYKPKMTRDQVIQALLNGASKQSILSFALFKPSPRKALFERPTTPPPKQPVVIDLVSPPPKPKNTSNQNNRLRELILKVEPKFIRIQESMFDLLQRLNLVYFRITQQESNSILLPLILSRTKKRKYPDYTATRTVEVFSSREHLIAYETALKLEADIETALAEGTERVERAQAAYDLFETVYERWKELVAATQANGDEGAYARPGLERFEEGHVLTRIVCKGADALASLHRYDEEVSLLRELLAQRRWRKGKRGAWYDRLALVLMQHQSKPEEAMQVVIDALHDELTHLVTRPRLVRRLARLEKRLKVPVDETHICEVELRKAESVTIEGIRIHQTRQKSVTPITSFFSAHGASRSRSPSLSRQYSDEKVKRGPVGVHSVWLSKDGVEIGVEEVALEHYATMDYRGFHSEGRIVRHIFLLLFWSIIFQPVEGAFETAYQIAPLDIGHDSFFFSRKPEIEKRLAEIENGEGARIAKEVDERERKLNTFAIGASWDLFTREDTLEVIECLGGKSLASICRIICEDYTHRSSGVPDLLIWRTSDSTAKFVEVKGPGDTLMENQKVWIDVLLGSGIDVEVCHVTEKGAQPQIKTGRAKVKYKGKTKAKPKPKPEEHDNDVESEDEVEVDRPSRSVPRRSVSGSRSNVQTPEPSTKAKPKRKSSNPSEEIIVVDSDDDDTSVKESPASLKRSREVFIIGKEFPAPKKAKKSKTM